MRVSQMKTVLVEIVQAFFHINAGLRFPTSHLDRFERSPWAVPSRKICAVLVLRDRKDATGRSKNMYLHYSILVLGPSNGLTAAVADGYRFAQPILRELRGFYSTRSRFFEAEYLPRYPFSL